MRSAVYVRPRDASRVPTTPAGCLRRPILSVSDPIPHRLHRNACAPLLGCAGWARASAASLSPLDAHHIFFGFVLCVPAALTRRFPVRPPPPSLSRAGFHVTLPPFPHRPQPPPSVASLYVHPADAPRTTRVHRPPLVLGSACHSPRQRIHVLEEGMPTLQKPKVERSGGGGEGKGRRDGAARASFACCFLRVLNNAAHDARTCDVRCC